jgi:hypothetical protein
MVVGYFNVVGIPLMPSKTYPPLIVNADAVLSLAVAGKLLKPIARRHLQVIQMLSTIQDQ